MTGMIPEPRTRGTIRKPEGTSLELYTRSRKARAMARADHLPRRQCYRSVLRFLVKFGRGDRCRSWCSAEYIAKAIPKSGIGERYSKEHVRRELVLMELDGITRSVGVRPGERFPHPERPDLDGGGEASYQGGRVREVNIGALLGAAPVWPARARRVRSQPASDFADVEGTDPEASAAGAQLRGLVGLAALEDGDGQGVGEDAPAGRVEPAAGEPPAAEASDHQCQGASDHPCRPDLGSPTENHLHLERSRSGSRAPAGAPGRPLTRESRTLLAVAGALAATPSPSPARVTTANAGSRRDAHAPTEPGRDTLAQSESASQSPRDAPREREHGACLGARAATPTPRGSSPPASSTSRDDRLAAMRSSLCYLFGRASLCDDTA